MWRQTIYEFGADTPRSTIARSNENVAGQREYIRARPNAWVIALDEPDLLVAVTIPWHTHDKKGEVWLYQKLG